MRTHLLALSCVVILGTYTGLKLTGGKQSITVSNTPVSPPSVVVKPVKEFKYFKDYKTYDEILKELETYRIQQEAKRKAEWDRLRKEFQLAEKRRIEKLREARQRELEAQRRELESFNSLINKLISYGVSPSNANLYVNLATQYGKQYKIDRAWILAMMKTESNFNPEAVSSHGAIGLMQMLPSTAKSFGISSSQLFNPSINVQTCTKYLAYLRDQFGSLELATIAYNQGEGNVRRGSYNTRYFYKVKQNYQSLIR
jgi:soluble lytic murein transglycosylase-like protein